jgi:hypothetical protein
MGLGTDGRGENTNKREWTEQGDGRNSSVRIRLVCNSRLIFITKLSRTTYTGHVRIVGMTNTQF